MYSRIYQAYPCFPEALSPYYRNIPEFVAIHISNTVVTEVVVHVFMLLRRRECNKIKSGYSIIHEPLSGVL
jgi:hypothetical protein